jgi:hypothetical protein
MSHAENSLNASATQGLTSPEKIRNTQGIALPDGVLSEERRLEIAKILHENYHSPVLPQTSDVIKYGEEGSSSSTGSDTGTAWD